MKKINISFEDIEKYVGKGLFTCEKFAREFCGGIRSSYFSDEYRNFYVLSLIKILKKNEYKAPDKNIFLDVLKNDVDGSVVYKKVKEVFEEDIELDFVFEDNYEFITNEVQTWIRIKALHNAIREGIDIIDEGDVENLNKVKELIDKAFQSTVSTTVAKGIWSDLDSLMEDITIESDGIPTGYDLLDSRIGGGFHKKSLVVFLAPSNVGKSLMLHNLALKQVELGKNVLLFTLEMSRTQCFKRFIPYYLGIPTIQIFKRMDEIRTRLKVLKNMDHMGEMFIIEHPEGVASVNDLIVEATKNMALNDNKPYDAIFVDYLGCCRTEGGDNSFEKLKEVAQRMRAMAYMFNCPVITAQQTGRSSFNNEDSGMQDVQGSLGIPQVSDVTINLNQTEKMEKISQIGYKIKKCRYANKGEGGFFMFDPDFMKLDEIKKVYQPETEENNSFESLSDSMLDDMDKVIGDKDDDEKQRGRDLC